MPSRIEDYALIGNCRTAALVGRDGSIDWLCFPRFDSGACFAALLGDPEHGRWSLRPRHAPRTTTRRYRPGTLILETELAVDGGRVRITDFMAPQHPTAAVYRIVEGIEGEVEMDSTLTIRFDYGAAVPWLQPFHRYLRATAGPDTVYLRADVPMEIGAGGITSNFAIRAGHQISFSLAWGMTHEPPPATLDPFEAMTEVDAWWLDWSRRCSYRGEWQEDVLASLVTLKALTYQPTGGIVAAPTTSLPEQIGGPRNWDYRYCWLRDATFTLYALLVGGYVEEARAWREWLVHAVAGDPSQLQIMYGVAGERRLTELELDWLPGYEHSQPVRIGNGAYRQHQLDVPGEIMEVLHLARRQGLDPHDGAWRIQQAVVEMVAEKWSAPDEGIWEVRGKRRHFTHSKVMAWVAADRAVKDIEEFGLPGEVDRWRNLRDTIRREVMAEGYNHEKKSFVQYYGGEEPDAALLMLPLVGFIDASDPRMVGTVKLIEERLVRHGLVDRYVTEHAIDGLPAGEGSFLLCSFWLADNLMLQGRADEARVLYERLLTLRNDVGLLSEEFDPVEKRMLGNFPQAFSHVGLVNTARNLTASGGPAADRANEEGDVETA